MEAELRDARLTWETASKQVKDRQKWRSLVEAPCATWALKEKSERIGHMTEAFLSESSY